MKPTIGRIIIAVVRNKHGALVKRPAIVVQPWGDTCVNAQVFMDGDGSESNDATPNVIWKTSITLDEKGELENSWHWPAKV